RLTRQHEEQWDWASVTRVLRRAFDAAPEDRALLVRLIDAYRAMGAEEEILRLLDGAADAELLILRARAREATGDDNGAGEDIRRIGGAEQVDAIADILGRILTRAAPNEADAYAMLLVEVLDRAKRFDDARRELVALLARNPDHAAAVEKLARLDAAAGAWD